MSNVVILVAMGVLAACGSGGVGPEFEGLDTPAGRLAAAQLGNASEFGREIVADGEVTAAEYERAVLATKRCIEDEGFAVEGPTLAANGVLLDLVIVNGGEDADGNSRVRPVYDRCSGEFLEPVSMVYAEQQVPSEEERREQLASLVTCFEDAGVSGFTVDTLAHEFLMEPTNPTYDGNFAVNDCVQRHEFALVEPYGG